MATWKKLLIAFVTSMIVGIIGVYAVIQSVKSSLPKLLTLEDYKPRLVTKVYDRNNKLIGEFLHEKRILLPYSQIPKNLINAFLAAEDDGFFEHGGVNYLAILRATIANIKAGHTVQGGSTITQQVAKTLVLANREKTMLRKVKEALMAQQMEEHFKKEEILYLYLNQIYFGQGAYGVATAAEVYFRKPVKDLTLAEMAILAGLPKAPTAYSPTHNPVRAKERQVYVLRRMADVGFIKKEEAERSIQEPVKVYLREKFETYAPFFLETVRQMLVAELGEDAVLDQGLRVRTSLDLTKQLAAQDAVRVGLKEVDKRQGYRGPLKSTTDPKEVGEFLFKTRNELIADITPDRTIQTDGKFKDWGPLDINYDISKGLPFYLPTGKTAPAIVSKVDDELGLVYVRVAEIEGIIDFQTMQWARKPNTEKRFDLDLIKKPSDALKLGDVILVQVADAKYTPSIRLQKILASQKKKMEFTKYAHLTLDQEPVLEASLMSIDQNTQEVIAMIGGYDFKKSEFNRALQAARQTGSSFKSIVYAAALDRGYTPSSQIMDAPIVFEESGTGGDEEGQDDSKTWKPSNHSKSFGGDIIMRNALVKSLNVPTVKIIEDIGVPYSVDYAKRLGIFSPLNTDFTMALGSSGVTLYEMTKVFSEFGRLGKKVRPILVQKVEDSNGKELVSNILLDKKFQKEQEEIEKVFEERRLAYLELKKSLDVTSNNSDGATTANVIEGTPAPRPPLTEKEKEKLKKSIDSYMFFEDPDQLMKPTTAYLTTSLLKAVIEDKNGTGGRAKALGREVAGKTGSSNGYYDAWFIGYTPQIATGVWVGFDHEKTIGKGEVGGRAALPIWLDYMKAAHENLPIVTFPVPEGIVFANIDSETGKLPTAQSKSIIRQAFLEGTEPTSSHSNEEEKADFYKQDLNE